MKKRTITFVGTLALIAAVFALAAVWQYVYKNDLFETVYERGYSQYVEKYAAEQKLDPLLVYAVIKNESGFNPQARSSIGARGLMQLTPDTFEWAQMLEQTQTKYTQSDLDTPEINIRYGTVVLSALVKQFGNEKTALAAYHAGRTNVMKWLADSRYSHDGKTLYNIPFSETRRYVAKVAKTKEIYKKLYN
jgi:soluble lytic murein transglycosylase